jgi:hypothetical protein
MSLRVLSYTSKVPLRELNLKQKQIYVYLRENCRSNQELTIQRQEQH